MRVLSWCSLIAFGVVLFSANGRAEDKCPKGDAPIFEDDLKAIPDCVAAHRLHDTCAWGSSGDSGLAGVVIPKCEAGFMARLSPAQKRTYAKRGERCSAAYSHDPNSMETSQAAMCLEELAVTYFKAAAAGSITGTPRWKGPAPAVE